MSVSESAPPAEPAAGPRGAATWWRRAPSLLPTVAGLAAVLGALTPPAVLAGTTVARRPAVPLAGDQALIQLAAVNAGHHAQLLGPYSRFGWHHPGPSWFYLLDGAFLPLRSHSWSLIAAVLLVHALVAALVVVLVWRRRGALAAVVASALLLAYFHSVGADKFLTPWNPYATLLPTILLLLLAGAAAEGSAASFCGLLVVASFLVQTHVSTAPAVAVVVAAAAVLLVVRHVRGWQVASDSVVFTPTDRLDWRARLPVYTAVGLVLLLVLMWIPPLIDQFGHAHGNLSQLVDYLRAAHGEHGLREGASALGHDLLAFPFGHYDDALATDTDTLGAGPAVAVLGFTVACGLLVWLGARLRDHLAQGIGVAALLAGGAAAWSVTRVTGPVDSYLLAWVTTLPVAVAIGYAALLGAPEVRRLLQQRRGVPGGAAAAAAGLAAALLLAQQAQAFASLDPHTQAPAEGGPIQAAASAAAAALPSGPVLVDAAHDPVAWPVATGITLRLVEDGRTVEVPTDWVSLWGDQFARRSDRVAGELLVVPAGAAVARLQANRGARQVASGLGTVVLLVPSPPAR